MTVTIDVSQGYEAGIMTITLVKKMEDGLGATNMLVDLTKDHELYVDEDMVLRARKQEDET